MAAITPDASPEKGSPDYNSELLRQAVNKAVNEGTSAEQLANYLQPIPLVTIVKHLSIELGIPENELDRLRASARGCLAPAQRTQLNGIDDILPKYTFLAACVFLNCSAISRATAPAPAIKLEPAAAPATAPAPAPRPPMPAPVPGYHFIYGDGVWAKRRNHGKVLQDSVESITKSDIRRLARRGGVKRMNGRMYEEIRGDLKVFLEHVICQANIYAGYRKRLTITPLDVNYALKSLGFKTLY